MSRYKTKDYSNRREYLDWLAERYGVDRADVVLLASLLGTDQDFDGLPSTLADLPAAKQMCIRDRVVTALRRTAVDHNIRLMHRLGHEQLFGNTLEAARGEKNPARLQAYVSIFEEYFTYWNASQKQQTLDFLYELLLIPDGDIRRRAAALIGRILAAFRLGSQRCV